MTRDEAEATSGTDCGEWCYCGRPCTKTVQHTIHGCDAHCPESEEPLTLAPKWRTPWAVVQPGYYILFRVDEETYDFVGAPIVAVFVGPTKQAEVRLDGSMQLVDTLDEECRLFGPIPEVLG